MSNTVLPIYTNDALEVGRIYSTIEVADTYYPDNEEFKLVNEDNQVRATGRVIKTEAVKFDHIGYPELKNNAAPQLQGWANAAEYFKTNFPEQFSYDAPVQLITFEVISNMKFDTPLTDSVKDEQELGLPTDEELGLNQDEEESSVSYVVEDK